MKAYNKMSGSFYSMGALMFILVLIVFPQPVLAATTTISLDFNSLPSAQGWTFHNGTSGIPDTSVFSVGGGVLHQNTIGFGASGFAYRLDGVVDASSPFTLTVIARVLNYEVQSFNNPYGFNIGVLVGTEHFDVGIAPGNIRGGASGGTLFSNSIDVSQVHEYRIEGTPGSGFFELFVDNISLGTAPAAVTGSPNGLFLGDGTAGANAEVEVSHYSFVQVSNDPPVCSGAAPSQDFLWPPQHQLEGVTIMGVTDPDVDPISITIISIFQDEPINGTGDGDVEPDGFGVGTSMATVRAERAGDGNGRMYHIAFSASDGQGGSCTGTVLVGVNHDNGKKGQAVDDGPLYNSTQ